MAPYLLSCLCSFRGHYEVQIINMSSWQITMFHVAWHLVKTWQKVCPCALRLQAALICIGHQPPRGSSPQGAALFTNNRATSALTPWAHVWSRHCCAAFELLKDSCCDSDLTQGSTKLSPPREDWPAASPTVRCVPLPGLSSYLLS